MKKYIAKHTFSSPFGNFYEKKVMKPKKKIPESTMKNWIEQGIVEVQDIKEDDLVEEREFSVKTPKKDNSIEEPSSEFEEEPDEGVEGDDEDDLERATRP